MTQAQRIIEHLGAGGTLSRLDAWGKLGILEAPARISELRAKGWGIDTEMVEIKNRYGERIKVARWHFRKTPENERRYLELRLQKALTRYYYAEKGSVDRQMAHTDVLVIEESIRQLKAIQQEAEQ